MYTPSECYPKKPSFLSINNLFWIYYKGAPQGGPPRNLCGRSAVGNLFDIGQDCLPHKTAAPTCFIQVLNS